MFREEVEFNGKTFVRYPESTSRTHRVYFAPQAGGHAKDIGALHQEIWRFVNGKIPEGYCIHHIDGNSLNNAIENLVCISPAEHARIHAPEHHDARAKHFASIRPLTKIWHGSEAGIEWHRQHGKRILNPLLPNVECSCLQCGIVFQSKIKRIGLRFCSRLCNSRWNESNRRYYEERFCIVCGTAFGAKKSKKQQCCSRACGWAKRRRESVRV